MKLLKKFGYIALASVMTLSLVACSTDKKETGKEEPKTNETAGNTEAATGIAKVGLGAVASVGSSKAYGEKDGAAQADNTIVAAAFDKDGKIVSVKIDVAQSKVEVKMDGSLGDIPEFKTKKELGPDYGMVGASKIGKEWFEQAQALEEKLVGKTVDEVKALAVEDNKLTDADFTSSVTIKVNDYFAALEKAWNNAVDAAGAEKISLGVNTTADKSKAAAEDKGASVQFDTVYALTAVDKDGKIVKVILDTLQDKVEFNADGTLAEVKEIKSKKELGDEYGMKGASKIGKEWFEQAAALEDYFVGKTLDDVKGLGIDEEQHVTDEALKSSVTIKVPGYQAVLVEALEK